MRLFPVLLLLLSLLAASSAATESKSQRKTLRRVKALKKSSKKSNATTEEQTKSASYHVPILVSAPSPHHIPPVSVEVRDDPHSPSDYHPIRPIHLVAPSSHHPQREYVYQGPVAVPLDYPYGKEQQASNDYEIHNRVSPGEYYSESYHGDLSAIPGIPGQDYPTFVDPPHTGFKCMQHTSTPGFYADVETRCQMWHYCQPDGRHDKFLCPNGTVFDQMTRVCNWWFNVHCDSSLSNYDINFDLYREPLRLSGSAHKVIENSIAPPPNSFLGHLENFEARSEYAPPIQSAAASQPVHRYPAKMAPAPSVRHDPDTHVDSSNAHTFATPVLGGGGHSSHSKTTPLFVESGRAYVKAADDDSPFGVYRTRVKSSDLKLQDVDKQRLKKRKRVSRRKLRKLKKEEEEEDDIPTYREPKATPAARRYRVVRRRKVHKQYQ